MSVRASIALAAVAASAFTLLVSLNGSISFAYDNPPLRASVETAAALVSAVAAQLAWGRFRQMLELRDVLLAGSLGVFAAANFAFAAVPLIAGEEHGSFTTWAPAGCRLLAAALMAGAAVVPDRALRRPLRDARRLLGACLFAVAFVGVAVALAGDELSTAIPPDLSPESAGRPRLVGDPAVLANEATVMLLFAVAAIGYARLAERTGDLLAKWLAVAATLGAFSRVNFLLFPSLYSPYFYTGDALRLAFFVALAAGGVLEMQRIRAALASAALLDERERIAREIHDGVAQDLAFILQHGRRLAGDAGSSPGLGALVTAAQRALDECRQAIATLTRTGEEPLAEALTLTVLETAAREGGLVETDIDADITLPAPAQDALLRVTREAVINAIRHGGAETVKVRLFRDAKVRLVVSDDGHGFEVATAVATPGRLGLRTMAARIRSIGGELTIDSSPERGTRVEVSLP